ncbi:hypothetical protein ACQ4PT_029651 [Festuca glaucescens]
MSTRLPLRTSSAIIQEADVYSARAKEWPGTSAPLPITTRPLVRAARRRKRKVGGDAAAGGTRWHVEKVVPILGPDNKSVGAYKRTLSYVQKTKNPPGTARKQSSNKSLGWIMVEIELQQKEGLDGPDQQLVLCKVYRSPRTDAVEASVPCSTSAPPPAASKSLASCDSHKVTMECKTTLDYNLHSPGVGRKPARKTGTRCRPRIGGKTTSGVAIVKKGPVTAAVTAVMKFSGSLMNSTDHMKEMAKLIFSFPAGGGNPVVVLSAMGKTTTNLLVAAGKVLSSGTEEASKMHELTITKEMHFRMIDNLGLDRSIVSGSFGELESVFMAIAKIKELTSKTRDYLLSFGENVSTTIFSAYLNKLGKGTCQEWESYAVNTCGRGGSDLTVTTIGRDLGSREIQVWKDVDGMLTCDPNVCANAIPLPYLTFDEAAELGLFCAHSVQLAMEGGIRVAVKNLFNPKHQVILTSIMLKSNVTMLNIKSRRMLDQSGFLAMSFSILEKLGIFVSCVVTSAGKISLITIPSKTSSHELVQLELDSIIGELKEIAIVDRLEDRSAISLIGNAQMAHRILEKALNVIRSINVTAQMISQTSSEVMKISFVVNDHEAERCVQALHSAFFDKGLVSEAQVAEVERAIPSAVASSSGVKKRKAGGEHQATGVRQERADITADRSHSVIEHPIMPDAGGDDYVSVPAEHLDIIPDDNPVPVKVDNDGLAGGSVMPQPKAVQPEQPSSVDANHGAQEEYNKLRAFLDHDSPMPVRGDNGDGDPLAWFADILEPDDYPMFDDSGLDGIPMLNAEAEQQGRLAEAAEGGSPLVTEEEEVIEALIAGATPDKFFGSPSSDMSWSPPALASSSSLHVAGECQAAFCGLCFTEEIGI